MYKYDDKSIFKFYTTGQYNLLDFNGVGIYGNIWNKMK